MNFLAPFIRTTDFAAQAHGLQKRQATGLPYILHPIGVARILIDMGETDLATLQAAVLHDVLEDTKVTEEQLRAQVGDEVTAIVLEVTDDKKLPKDERKRLQVVHARTMSKKARLVKLADKLYNLTDLSRQPPPDRTLEELQGYFVWCRAVISAMPPTHQGLESALYHLIDDTGSTWFGRKHTHLPDGDLDEALQRYYALCAEKK